MQNQGNRTKCMVACNVHAPQAEKILLSNQNTAEKIVGAGASKTNSFYVSFSLPFFSDYKEACNIKREFNSVNWESVQPEAFFGDLEIFRGENKDFLVRRVLLIGDASFFWKAFREVVQPVQKADFFRKNTGDKPKLHVPIISGVDLSKHKRLRSFVDSFNEKKRGMLCAGKLKPTIFARYTWGWDWLGRNPSEIGTHVVG